jgi:hypothetical protein
LLIEPSPSQEKLRTPVRSAAFRLPEPVAIASPARRSQRHFVAATIVTGEGLAIGDTKPYVPLAIPIEGVTPSGGPARRRP